MSGTQHFDFKNERHIRTVISHLESQGARVVWNNGRGFPAKVFPPDSSLPFILFHGSVSDRNASTLKRNEVRRAGLIWPGDDESSRKETPMSIAHQEPAIELRAPGEHLKEPPGVRSFEKPTPSSLDAVRPVLAGMPETFWTDELVNRLKALSVAGFRAASGGSSNQRAQGMLDWLGYRVVEYRKNRGGFSYRWERDPAAPVKEGIERLAPQQRALRAVEAPAEPDTEKLLDKLEQQYDPTPPLPAEAGPIAEAMAEAQRKKAETPEGFQVFDKAKRKTKYERVSCVDCGRSFTPDGLEHHYETSGHGPVEVAARPRDDSAIEEAERAAADEALGEEPAGPAVPLQVTAPEVVHELTDEGEVDVVAKADYDAMEQIAQENEARATTAERELGERDADIERLQRELAEAKREREQVDLVWREQQAIREGQHQQAMLEAMETQKSLDAEEMAIARQAAGDAQEQRGTIFRELEAEREKYAQTLRALDTAREMAAAAAEARDEAIGRLAERTGSDGSWLIPWEQVGNEWTSTIVANAQKLGVTLELRGKVAGA